MKSFAPQSERVGPGRLRDWHIPKSTLDFDLAKCKAGGAISACAAAQESLSARAFSLAHARAEVEFDIMIQVGCLKVAELAGTSTSTSRGVKFEPCRAFETASADPVITISVNNNKAGFKRKSLEYHETQEFSKGSESEGFIFRIDAV